ncbi:MAG: uncharacterized protein KVP18_001288 [Porospora cf. gigantea A]|uniref:uncharacterized protein n=1 Tax=Porospora cf. gigantea A TaxID=2853593 RepID=UPI003559C635|nr:MAG: hypothetical protein KVP18_001288 [Porospora cf. gigantea A]
MRDHGIFEWLCNPDDEVDLRSGMLCDAQAAAFTLCLTLVSLCDFLSAALGGFFFDLVGSRACGLIGVMLSLSSLPMLSFGSNSGLIYAGFVVMGLSTGFLSYPTFSITTAFPNREDLMMSLMTAAQYGTVLIYPALYAAGTSLGLSFTQATMMYFFICLPFCVLYVISLPRETRTETTKTQRRPAPHAVWFYLGTVEWVCMTIWSATFLTGFSSYDGSVVHWASPFVSTFYQFFNIAGLFSTLLFGWIALRIPNVSPLLTMTSIGLIVAFGCAYLPGDWRVVSCLWQTLIANYYFAAKYVYVNQVYPPEFLGRLTGLSSVVAGVVQLSASAILSSPYTIRVEGCIVMAVVGSGGVASLFLVYRSYYLERNYKSDGCLGSEAPIREEFVTQGESSERNYKSDGRLGSEAPMHKEFVTQGSECEV